MQPDAFMPFYGDKFFGDISEMSNDFLAAYLRALWKYWSATHCQGLINDDEQLQRICIIYGNSWSIIKDQVFDNDRFFKLKDGKWHQKRAKEEWEKAVDKYNKSSKHGKLAAEVRWGK